MLNEGANEEMLNVRESTNLRTAVRPNSFLLAFSIGTPRALMPRMGKERDLKKRTMNFALALSDLCEVFPNTMKGRHVAGRLFRAGTAVAANYRAACRAKSKPDFIAKLGTVIEEADEWGLSGFLCAGLVN